MKVRRLVSRVANPLLVLASCGLKYFVREPRTHLHMRARVLRLPATEARRSHATSRCAGSMRTAARIPGP